MSEASDRSEPPSEHDHDHGGHDQHDHPLVHGHRRGSLGELKHLIRPHSHDPLVSIDTELAASKAGTRTLTISFAGLLATATIELVIFAVSHSVGLLADTIHNFADALTAVPIGIAFLLARRRPTRRYTYGYGRAEDLAGVAVLAVMAMSAGIAAWQAVARLIQPQLVGHLGWVAAAGGVGFLGNELAARYRIRIGTRIGSAALIADGRHARTDGFTSLAVVAGAVGVALGWRQADPIVGLAITIAILSVLRTAAKDVLLRLLDGVDPGLVGEIEQRAAAIDGVQNVNNVRLRWVGHQLRAEIAITVDQDLPVQRAHQICQTVHHDLLHHVPRLVDTTIHTDPCGHDGNDHHAPASNRSPAPTSP